MPDNPTSWNDIGDFIRDAAQEMRESGLTLIDVEHNGSRIRIKAKGPKFVYSESSGPARDIAAPIPIQQPKPVESGDRIVASPMIGTFYTAPSPGEPEFVEEGDQVEVGQVIGIIEAMKIMNEITSEFSGIVSGILVNNAQAVEYGQPLFRITPNE